VTEGLAAPHGVQADFAQTFRSVPSRLCRITNRESLVFDVSALCAEHRNMFKNARAHPIMFFSFVV
jgi:hypothetical protein